MQINDPQAHADSMGRYSPMLSHALLAGEVDLALLMDPPITRTLALTELLSERLVVLMPPEDCNGRTFFTCGERSPDDTRSGSYWL